jgi:hypothetical protein
VSGRGWTFEEALERATAAVDEGKGLEALRKLRAASNSVRSEE